MRTIYPLGNKAEKYILQNSFRRKISRGKYLLKPGEFCSHYYYIHEGVLRAFIKEDNKEITTWINPENEITTSIRSMTRSEPSLEYIQALENSELYVMSFESLQKMYTLFPVMNIVIRMLLTEYYAASEERSYICRLPSAEKRYDHFNASRPELVNRIPLKYIASYLGMSEETLSRLRSRKTPVK
ncbi:Crp/Fnr family transcriptional regulator [Agriterribacter sp.]|uniref:Crp/Fnr family transcriptional regulator n=1 Tax=Agriterribacter sp. TaxID=2821509 RepID=UPI002B675034|nr:Crp/Fnr family transcriptional regulator [Agriterribacter sp.]HRP56274.1 Crp/Fnr family transcriptional regulator [Agriterribacter sp.]